MTGLHFFGIGACVFAVGILKLAVGLWDGEPLAVGVGLVLMAVPGAFVLAREALQG